MQRKASFTILLLCLLLLFIGNAEAVKKGQFPAKDNSESLGSSSKAYLDAYLYQGYIKTFLEFPEVSAPATPSANYGRLYVKDVGGTTSLMFKDGAGTETNLITALSGAGVDAANGVWFGTNAFIFEGATANAFELSLSPADVTADRVVTFADAAGTVMLSTLATNAPDAANSVSGASNALVFEGATADAHETSVVPADATADRTVTLADASGTVMLSGLATNAPEAANSVTGASNALVFEGATANDYETVITPTDPTADRTVTLPDKSGTVAMRAGTIAAKTSDYPMTAADVANGVVFTNAGATGAVTITLLEASQWIGVPVTFITYAAQNFNIDPADANDTLLTITNSPGDKITNSTAGNSITLMPIDSTNIVVVADYGTWSDAN